MVMPKVVERAVMGVWESIIGLAAAAVKDHPRKEVLERLLTLRDAMHACQKTYDDYQAIFEKGGYEVEMERRQGLPKPAGVSFSIMYDPRDAWGETVAGLAQALTGVGDVLTIFSPDAGESVRFYGITEAMSADEDRS